MVLFFLQCHIRQVSHRLNLERYLIPKRSATYPSSPLPSRLPSTHLFPISVVVPVCGYCLDRVIELTFAFCFYCYEQNIFKTHPCSNTHL